MKKLKHEEVEVQITPMLDMAFQLLTFFILTFRPMPTEGQFSMNLLPSSPSIDITQTDKNTEQNDNSDTPAMLRTLTVQLRSNLDGSLAQMSIGESDFPTLEQLQTRLKEIVADKTLPFDQAVIQSDPGLKYEDLMRVIDVFAGPEVGITKLSFSELSGV